MLGYGLDIEAYNTLPEPRPWLLRAEYEPGFLPPRRSLQEKFPLPTQHSSGDFPASVRKDVADSKEGCSFESVFWAEGRTLQELEAIGPPDIDGKRNALIPLWIDIKETERWEDLTEDILLTCLAIEASELLDIPWCERKSTTASEWWTFALEQLSVAKKNLREETPVIPPEYVRLNTILDDKNCASLVYVKVVHYLRRSFTPYDLKPVSIAAELREAQEYYKQHEEAMETALEQARSRIEQDIQNSPSWDDPAVQEGDSGGDPVAPAIIPSVSGMTMTSSASTEIVITPPTAQFERALVLSPTDKKELESHKKLKEVTHDNDES